MNRDTLKARLIDHEGLLLKPYRDSEGVLTIGIGRNLDHVGITEAEARALCDSDIATAEKGLDALAAWWRTLDETRQQVLCEMAFNLGASRLMGFTKFLAALQRRDYETAGDEMLDSRWATQVGNRAVKLSKAMKTGAF